MAVGNFATTRWINFGATAAQYRITGNITISAWVYASSIAAEQYILSKTNADTNLRCYWLQAVGTTGYVRLALYYATAGYIFVNSTVGLIPNRWTHVLATYVNGKIRIYFDAVPVGEADYTGSIFDAASVPLAVGITRPSGPALPWTGGMHDVRIYNVGVNASQVNNICRGQGADNEINGLVLRTCLDNGTDGASLAGQIVRDHSKYANHATVTGAPIAKMDPFGGLVPSQVG